MAADASAYAILGLEPGADSAAIERAYKRLIKQHHPDRAGGDARRAAEINRAYRELRLAGRVREALDLQDWAEVDLERGGRMRAMAIFAAIAVVVAIIVGPMIRVATPLSVPPSLQFTKRPDPATLHDVMAEPIDAASIEEAVGQALAIIRERDEMALASASQDCFSGLREQPRVAALDRCAAFDDAAVQLLDRDPLRDRGPFSELSVTGRQMNAATLLSNDYLAIDSRLDRIRLRVELALAARLHPAPEAPVSN